MSKSQFTEADLIPNPLPLDLNGRPTTKEQWENYQMEVANHRAKIERKREFLDKVLTHALKYGLDSSYKHFTSEINMESSMDAPNKPGYYRANKRLMKTLHEII